MPTLQQISDGSIDDIIFPRIPKDLKRKPKGNLKLPKHHLLSENTSDEHQIQQNIWAVSSLFRFTKTYFCCPVCDSIEESKEDFINHVSTDHALVSNSYTE